MKPTLLIALALAGCSSQPLSVYVADDGIRMRGYVHTCLQSFETMMDEEPRTRPVVVKNLSKSAGDEALKLQNALRGMGFQYVELEVGSPGWTLSAPVDQGADLRTCRASRQSTAGRR